MIRRKRMSPFAPRKYEHGGCRVGSCRVGECSYAGRYRGGANESDQSRPGLQPQQRRQGRAAEEANTGCERRW